jgi:hypothetical protein
MVPLLTVHVLIERHCGGWQSTRARLRLAEQVVPVICARGLKSENAYLVGGV